MNALLLRLARWLPWFFHVEEEPAAPLPAPPLEIPTPPTPEEPPPPDLGWMRPEADAAKEALLGKPWGTVIDDYLWYELGEIDGLDDAEETAVIKEAFPSGATRFGDVELHRAEPGVLPGDPALLRLRGPVRILPALTIRGRRCALFEVGHIGLYASEASPGSINFHTEWNKAMGA